MNKNMVKSFFDETTYTLTYVVFNENTKDAIIIDPVLDYDAISSTVNYVNVEKVLNFITRENLNLHFVFETHAHADHLSGAAEIKKRIPHVKVAIGKNITKVQALFGEIFNLKDLNVNGEQFDELLEENQSVQAGSMEIKVLSTPGHTPACSSYLIDDMVFTGDALFMPDYGTGRCDFPAGSAKDLYHSVHEKLYKLPDDTRVFTGHDYQPGGREVQYESTIGENKEINVHLRQSTTCEEFVSFRVKRDSSLKAPKLLYPSVQVNIDAGHLPKEEDNGQSYLKIPVKIK